MTGWTKAWIAWGLGFAVIEAFAVRVDRASLSEHLRMIFGFSHHGPLRLFRRSVFLGFWVWFVIHLFGDRSDCVSCINPPMPPS